MAFVPSYGTGAVLNRGVHANPESTAMGSPAMGDPTIASTDYNQKVIGELLTKTWAASAAMTTLGYDYNTSTNRIYLRVTGTSASNTVTFYVFAQGSQALLASGSGASGAANIALDVAYIDRPLVILATDGTDNVMLSALIPAFTGHPAV